MAEKFNVTGEQRDDIDGQMIEIKRQLRVKSGSPIDPELVKLALDDIVEGNFIFKGNKSAKTNLPVLRLIFGGEKLSIKALTCERLIYNANETFKLSIDESFINWNLNKVGVATPEMPVQVHEIIQDSTFIEVFLALPGAWDQKWLSQNQIIEFCETLPGYLKTGGQSTMFLTKKDESKPVYEDHPCDNLVVVCVCIGKGNMRADVGRLGHNHVWGHEQRRRVVSPKLIFRNLRP